MTIVGDQDASTALSLEQILAPALASGRALVIDLTAVDFMDASTVRVLLMAERSLATHGQRVRVRGARPGPRRVLHLCGLDRLLTERR